MKIILHQPVRNSITGHFVLTNINKITILVAERFASATHKHHSGPIIADPCQNFQLIQRWLTIIDLTRLSLLYDVLDRFHKWKFDLHESLMCMNQHYLRNCKKYWSSRLERDSFASSENQPLILVTDHLAHWNSVSEVLLKKKYEGGTFTENLAKVQAAFLLYIHTGFVKFMIVSHS